MRVIDDRWLDQGAHARSVLRPPWAPPRARSSRRCSATSACTASTTDLANAKIPFVRFADDFLLFATERGPAERALTYATKRLDRLGLDIHPEKTQVVQSGPEVQFLGERLPGPARTVAKKPKSKKRANG